MALPCSLGVLAALQSIHNDNATLSAKGRPDMNPITRSAPMACFRQPAH